MIYRYDDIVAASNCNTIYDFYNTHYTNDLNDDTKLPWFEGNTIYWQLLKNTEVKNQISLCRDVITQLTKDSYGVDVFPHLTTLVMWKTGKSMAIHKDDGYEHDKKTLHMRKYTAVMYMNDGFVGGETIIMKENSDETEYASVPKKGSVIIFKSDESCLHGVNKIIDGNRLTLSMWFSIEEKYSEK